MKKIFSFISIFAIQFLFAQELAVDGNLKVTGQIDAQGQTIKNVGNPTLTTDAANVQYVDERTSTRDRIISLKCGWLIYTGNQLPDIGSCEPPPCPDGWNELTTYNEIVSTSVTRDGGDVHQTIGGNSVKLCMEDLE